MKLMIMISHRYLLIFLIIENELNYANKFLMQICLLIFFFRHITNFGINYLQLRLYTISNSKYE